MIPVKLTLSNFTSYGQNPPELDFTKFKLAAISGLNGAGKSSLLDSITWCLWGTSRAGDSSDDLIHLGAAEMQVEFSFKLDKHIYTVKRRRSKKGGGSTNLEFWSGSHNLTEGTIKTTQQKIIDTLHLTFETFTNSAYLRQGHADEFTTKGPTDRKRILADILGLDHYDKLEEKAKEKSKETHTKLQLLDYQLLEIESELTQKEDRSEKKRLAEQSIAKVEEKIKTMEQHLTIFRQQKETLKIAAEQRVKIEQNYSQNKKELEEILLQGRNRKDKIATLKEELGKLKDATSELSQLKGLQEQKDIMEETRQKRSEKERELSDISGKINLKKQQEQQLRVNIEKLTQQLTETKNAGAKCPTCGQEIGKLEKVHVHKTLIDQIDSLKKDFSVINSGPEETKAQEIAIELRSLIFDPLRYQEICSKIKKLEQAQAAKEQLLKTQASLDAEEKVVAEMRVMFVNKKTAVEALEKEMLMLPDLSEKIFKVTQDIAGIENELLIVRDEEKKAQGVLGQINELISRTAQMEKLQKIKSEEKLKLQKDKEVFEELALAFGKKGIQAMIIEQAIPEIEDETNKLLEKLTEGRMKIKLETQKETKTKMADGEKGIVETLDIIISDEMGERNYEMFSGGETFRVNFAIRLAISKLLTHRAGARLQFLVIDEGFGTQDTPGRARLVEVLDAIKNDFEKILIITHIEELKEEFPVRIEVAKNSSGSTFEVIGI